MEGCGRQCPGPDRRGCGCAVSPRACDADRFAPRTRTAPVPDSPPADNWLTAADRAAGSRLRPASVGSSSRARPRSRPMTAAGSCPALVDSPPVLADSPPALADSPPALADSPPALADNPPALADNPPALADSPPTIVDKRRPPPVVVHSSGSGLESWPVAVDSSAAADEDGCW